VNIKNVVVSETETITSNALVLGADPLVSTGFGEEDILTIILPYINSAREGDEKLGNILEKYGNYEMNGIGFQDENEIWWFETIGGHHFISKRVQDNEYAVIPNQQGIESFDFVDAFSEKKYHIYFIDLIDFIINNKLDLSKKYEDLKNEKIFNVHSTFGSHTDFDKTYNAPRAWFMHKYLSPKNLNGKDQMLIFLQKIMIYLGPWSLTTK
jgi:dipeptidase